MSDKETLDVYSAKVADYVGMTHDVPSDNLLAFIKALPENSRALDLGCGPGHAAAVMASHGIAVEAWDLSQGMVDHASTQPGVTALLKGFDDLPATPSFGGIYANFSLLHAGREDFQRHIADIAASLVGGGVFHIGMKTGTGEHRDALGRRYTYHTLDDLMTILNSNGLTPIWHKEGREKGMAGTIDPFVLIRAVKHG